MDFRNDIQGLRALAVLLVFIFHLSASWMPGGFIGVDIFFVISGYLVSSILLHKIGKGSFSIISFYESRIKRIAPAYYFLLLFTALGATFIFLNTDIYTFRKSLVWSMIFNSNNHFATLDNYFGTASSENPLLHTWTLAVEMQFYFILPLLLLLIKNRKLLSTVLIVLTAVCIAYGTYNVYNGQAGKMYFSLIARMPEFLIGVLAATLNLRNLSFVKSNSLILSGVGLFAILVCGFLFNEGLPFPGIITLIPCIATVLILIGSNNKINDFFANKTLVYIGEISYSVYLWHWPVMAFLRYNNDSYELPIQDKIIATILTIILSLISYYLVERSLRKSPGLRFYLPFSIIGIFTASLVFLSVKINTANQGSFKEFYAPTFGLDSHGTTFEKVGLLGDTTTQDDKILFLGDSHALSMKRFIDVLGKKNHFFVRTITNNTYPTIPGISEEEFTESRFYDQYNDLMDKVNVELPSAKLIIIQFFGDGKRWTPYIKEFLGKLNSGQKVLILNDFPILDKNPAKTNRHVVRNLKSKNIYKVVRTDIDDELVKLIESNQNTRIISFNNDEVFKDVPFYKDTLMYYDKAHLNTYGSKVYALSVEGEFMKNLKWGVD